MASPSNRIIKTICVFCGTEYGNDREVVKAACKLGETLAKNKINLVYGGGSIGLRGSVAVTAAVGGSKIFSVILKALAARREIMGMTVGNELQVSTIHERMVYIMQSSDAFITLPGGFDTLEDTFNILSWTRLNMHKKPIGLLNVNGFYDGLLSFLDHAVEQGFMTQTSRRNVISASTVEKLMRRLQKFVPEPDPLMMQVAWFPKDNKDKKPEVDLNLRL